MVWFLELIPGQVVLIVQVRRKWVENGFELYGVHFSTNCVIARVESVNVAEFVRSC